MSQMEFLILWIFRSIFYVTDHQMEGRHIGDKCKLCHIKLVNRQPLNSMPFSKYKKGNMMCKECRLKCKQGLVKCQDCSYTARHFLILVNDDGYAYLATYCEECI